MITSVSAFTVIITGIIQYRRAYNYLIDKDVFYNEQIEDDLPIYYQNTTFIISNDLKVILSNDQVQTLLFIEIMGNNNVIYMKTYIYIYK